MYPKISSDQMGGKGLTYFRTNRNPSWQKVHWYEGFGASTQMERASWQSVGVYGNCLFFQNDLSQKIPNLFGREAIVLAAVSYTVPNSNYLIERLSHDINASTSFTILTTIFGAPQLKKGPHRRFGGSKFVADF